MQRTAIVVFAITCVALMGTVAVAEDWPPSEAEMAAEIKAFLAAGHAVDERVEWSSPEGPCVGTHIHRAAMAGHASCVALLLDAGAKVHDDSMDMKGYIGVYTPLGLACRFRHRDVVELLLARGAEVNFRGLNGNGALWGAAAAGDLALAEFLVASGAKVNPEAGATALSAAVEHQQMLMIEWLLAQGAEVKPGANSYRLVSQALGLGQIAMAVILVHHGASVQIENDYSYPLAFAAERGDVGLVELLLEHGAEVNAVAAGRQPVTALHEAARANRIDVARLLLERGAKVNVADYTGNTPLHRACMHARCVEMVELLLDRGADANARNDYGLTPLHEVRDSEAAELLLAKGAAVDTRTKDGYQPIHTAGDVWVLRSLLAKGAEVNAKTTDGSTPLHTRRDPQILLALLEAGADVNALDGKGQTPLHRHASWRNGAAVLALLTAQPDLTIKDKEGKTAADLARPDPMIATGWNLESLLRK